ncbi:MAG: zinc ribbon domain-containing protein [Armatimonadota bacterium]
MGLFDQLKREAKDLAGKASQAASRAQINLEIDALQQRIDKVLIKAGQVAVQLQRNRRIDDSALKELSKDLASLESRMAALRRALGEPQGDPEPSRGAAPAEPATGSGIPARQTPVEGPICPSCQQGVEMEQAFCGNCGQRLSACAACGTIVLATDQTCSNCGSDL